MVLSILHQNVRSLIANGQESKHFIEELSVKPNITCIQETWLKPSLDFIIHGYTAVRKNRSSAIKVITFIKQGSNYRERCLIVHMRWEMAKLQYAETLMLIVGKYKTDDY